MGGYCNETNTKNNMEENKPERKKGLIGKLKDIGEEKEHQLEVLGTLVRL